LTSYLYQQPQQRWRGFQHRKRIVADDHYRMADDRYRMTDETMEATMMLILVEEGADPARQ